VRLAFALPRQAGFLRQITLVMGPEAAMSGESAAAAIRCGLNAAGLRIDRQRSQTHKAHRRSWPAMLDLGEELTRRCAKLSARPSG